MRYKIFAQRTVLIFLANLILGLSGIVLLPILTKNLSVADYGIWVQLNVTVILLSTVIVMGLPSYSMVRFLAGEKNKKKIQEGFYSIAFAILMVSFLISLIFFVFADQISQILFAGNITIVEILSLLIIFFSLNDLFQCYFITFQQIKRYSLFLSFKALGLVFFVSIFVLYGEGVIWAAAGFLCNEILFFLITLSIILSKIGIILPKFTELKDYLHLSLPTVPGSLSYWVVEGSDRYLIGILLSVSAVGFYSPGYSLGALVLMLASPITSILTAALSKSYNQQNEDEVKILLEYSIKYFLFIAIPAVIGLSVLSKPLLLILSTNEIANASYIITPFVAVGFLFLGLINMTVNMVILKKKTKIIGITWFVAALINFILNLLFIPIFGILGAAISTLISYTIPLIVIGHYSFKFIKLELNYVFFIKVILASVPIVILSVIWEPMGIIGVLLFVLVSIILYLTFVMILKVFTKEEFAFMKSFIKFQ